MDSHGLCELIKAKQSEAKHSNAMCPLPPYNWPLTSYDLRCVWDDLRCLHEWFVCAVDRTKSCSSEGWSSTDQHGLMIDLKRNGVIWKSILQKTRSLSMLWAWSFQSLRTSLVRRTAMEPLSQSCIWCIWFCYSINLFCFGMASDSDADCGVGL